MNFPGFAGPVDRDRLRARLAEKAILGGATAKRPIGRPVSVKHPIRQVDRNPICCIQTGGLSHKKTERRAHLPLLDRVAGKVVNWSIRGVAAVFAFILMAAAPGWIEAALASQQAPWGF